MLKVTTGHEAEVDIGEEGRRAAIEDEDEAVGAREKWTRRMKQEAKVYKSRC